MGRSKVAEGQFLCAEGFVQSAGVEPEPEHLSQLRHTLRGHVSGEGEPTVESVPHARCDRRHEAADELDLVRVPPGLLRGVPYGSPLGPASGSSHRTP